MPVENERVVGRLKSACFILGRITAHLKMGPSGMSYPAHAQRARINGAPGAFFFGAPGRLKSACFILGRFTAI